MLQYSEACERNKGPIAEKLLIHLDGNQTVLEVGSGTGQHVSYFSKKLPRTTWYPSDLIENLPGIEARMEEEPSENVAAPLVLDVKQPHWIDRTVDVVFTANTLHIISPEEVECFYEGVGRHLKVEGLLCVYGPFRYKQSYTSPSNEQFDQWLKQRDPRSGIRAFEWLMDLAQKQNLKLLHDYAMPANNQFLIWQRETVDD